MADVDDLIEQALAEKEAQDDRDHSNCNLSSSMDSISTDADSADESKKVENEKPNVPLYRRVKKGEKQPSAVKNIIETGIDEARAAGKDKEESGSSESNSTASTPEPAVEERKETIEELRAKLKAKSRSKRQDLIQKRTNKKEKARQGALTPIYYCDATGCRNVTKTNGKCCPKCQCFFYCSVDCQKADWVKHKDMCGKTPTPEGLANFDAFIKARDAAQELYTRCKTGDYITVMNEKADLSMPACMFASVAERSNVLYWKTYMQNPIFTTAKPDTIGSLGYKLEAAMAAFPNKKVYLISVILDRIRDDKTTDCVLRMFIADAYGGTMDSPADGKITKQVARYVRKVK